MQRVSDRRPRESSISRPRRGPIRPRGGPLGASARVSRGRLIGAVAALAAAFALLAAGAGTAAAKPTRTVHFDGREIQVPKGWTVHRLAAKPRMCVRMDRRAVYLGTPSAQQRCPAGAAVGRSRAILVEPRSAARAKRSALPAVPRRSAGGATFSRAGARASGTVFTGLGFDACTAPSAAAMRAWLRSSPYRAIGVYIGGRNRACSQPNLTASWVAEQTAAGWHLIPTYVGLQAPTSSCTSCARLNPSLAASQGAAEALDAVNDAAAIGIGPGSPIYNDMESYTQTTSATNATLAYLEGWTKKLHQLGYESGVYSSSGSGIEDLVGRIGTLYTQPDHIWIANWNGRQDTYDPVVPANAWVNHQRIHQYRGGHNETWGGVTINIDNNYVDASTVGNSTPPGGPDDPVGALDSSGSPRPGHLRVRGWAFDPNDAAAPLAIRVSLGGREGVAGAETFDIGAAALPRGDVARRYPQAGRRHGFDVTVPILKSGRQTVCAYAVNLGAGGDRLLGCRQTRIGAAVTLAGIKAKRGGVRVRVACAWPAGTECPGRLLLRAKVKVLRRAGGGRLRTRVVNRSLGRVRFHLTGETWKALRIPYSGRGKRLLRQRGKLRTQLIAAIPGGRRVVVLRLGR